MCHNLLHWTSQWQPRAHCQRRRNSRQSKGERAGGIESVSPPPPSGQRHLILRFRSLFPTLLGEGGGGAESWPTRPTERSHLLGHWRFHLVAVG